MYSKENHICKGEKEMKIIAWIVLIWIVGSCFYGKKTGEFDESNFLQAIKTELKYNPVAKVIFVIVVLILVKILFF